MNAVNCRRHVSSPSNCSAGDLDKVKIKGPTEVAVGSQVQALTEKGSRLVSPPAPAAGGGWVAICDESDQVYKW